MEEWVYFPESIRLLIVEWKLRQKGVVSSTRGLACFFYLKFIWMEENK